MTCRKNKAVSIIPLGIFRIVSQIPSPQGIRHRCGAHRHAGMSGFRFLNRIHRKRTDGVDTELIESNGFSGNFHKVILQKLREVESRLCRDCSGQQNIRKIFQKYQRKMHVILNLQRFFRIFLLNLPVESFFSWRCSKKYSPLMKALQTKNPRSACGQTEGCLRKPLLYLILLKSFFSSQQIRWSANDRNRPHLPIVRHQREPHRPQRAARRSPKFELHFQACRTL